VAGTCFYFTIFNELDYGISALSTLLGRSLVWRGLMECAIITDHARGLP